MWKVVVLLPFALLGTTTPAAAHYSFVQEPGFDLRTCAVNATHILVVDMHGRVVEVWKGNANPGDRIPIDRFFSPVLPRISAGKWGEEIPPLGNYWPGNHFLSPSSSERLVLFLVKSDRQDETTKFLEGWLPASESGWFASSTARVDRFGCFRVRPAPWNIGPAASASFTDDGGTTEADAKAGVRELLNRAKSSQK